MRNPGRTLTTFSLLTCVLGAAVTVPSQRPQDDGRARAFVAAARRGDENAVRKSLDEDAGLVHATDVMGMTALDWAATREHWHIFAQLLTKGAPVNRIGFDGGTVLHRAAHHDRPDMVELLLDAGADLRIQNQWGRSALHVAARRGNEQVARLLLERGADLRATTREGWSPLHVAYRSGHPDMVGVLLAAGADPLQPDTSGALPAQHAFQRPAAESIDPDQLYQYQGLYDVTEDFHFKVWIEGGALRLEDFSADDLYATGSDAFYCRSEPWSVRFFRDAEGAIGEIEVQFLRQAVRGRKRPSPLYVGSHVCMGCHSGGEGGGAYVRWLSSRHAGAYWRLATDWSLFLAHQRPHFQDVTNPREDDRCLLCHATAAQDVDALFAKTFERQQGVGCEACHGPGSDYIDPAVMADRAAFVAAGGRVPDEDTCRQCHRNPDHFSFDEWWPRVAHAK